MKNKKVVYYDMDSVEEVVKALQTELKLFHPNCLYVEIIYPNQILRIWNNETITK